MKVLAGDVKSILAKVKTEIEDRIHTMKTQVEEEKETRLKRAKEHAKQARELVLKDAEIKAREESKKIIRMAEKEANELEVIIKGKLEKEMKDDIRARLIDFINGKSMIAGTSYDQIVDNLIKDGKKAGLKFEKVKTKQGILLKGEKTQVDLTLDSLMNKLKLEELE